MTAHLTRMDRAIQDVVGGAREAMKTNPLGIDSNGQWTPAQFTIDAGWDHTCIAATARFGVSESDADGLTDEQQSALLEFCKSRMND